MDEWEDEHPEITDQRLFGFQHLSFSPNQTDPSNLRQVLATEVFRRQGVPTFYASFVEVSLDTGDGPRLLAGFVSEAAYADAGIAFLLFARAAKVVC